MKTLLRRIQEAIGTDEKIPVGSLVRAEGFSKSDLGDVFGGTHEVEGLWLGPNRVLKGRKAYPVQPGTVKVVQRATKKSVAQAEAWNERFKMSRDRQVATAKKADQEYEDSLKALLALAKKLGFLPTGNPREFTIALDDKSRTAVEKLSEFLFSQGYKFDRFGFSKPKAPSVAVTRNEEKKIVYFRFGR